MPVQQPQPCIARERPTTSASVVDPLTLFEAGGTAKPSNGRCKIEVPLPAECGQLLSEIRLSDAVQVCPSQEWPPRG